MDGQAPHGVRRLFFRQCRLQSKSRGDALRGFASGRGGIYRGPVTLLYTVRPRMRNTTNIAMNRKNRNFAIPIEAPAMPVKPNKPASKPTTKKTKAQRSIIFSFGWLPVRKRGFGIDVPNNR